MRCSTLSPKIMQDRIAGLQQMSDMVAILFEFYATALHQDGVRQFMQQHQRWSSDPGIAVEHAGQQAIRFQIADIESTASLTVLAHSQTLQVLMIS